MKEIILTQKPKVKINGIVCDLEIDDIRIYSQIEKLAAEHEILYGGIAEGTTSISEYLPIAKELLLLIVGKELYQSIFPTEKSQNDWVWHHQVVMGILPEIFEARMETIKTFTKDGLIESLKEEETEEGGFWKSFQKKFRFKGQK